MVSVSYGCKSLSRCSLHMANKSGNNSEQGGLRSHCPTLWIRDTYECEQDGGLAAPDMVMLISLAQSLLHDPNATRVCDWIFSQDHPTWS